MMFSRFVTPLVIAASIFRGLALRNEPPSTQSLDVETGTTTQTPGSQAQATTQPASGQTQTTTQAVNGETGATTQTPTGATTQTPGSQTDTTTTQPATGCMSSGTEHVSRNFSISFTPTLTSTEGTQCVYCESSTLESGDRLVFEDSELVLYLDDAEPSKQTFTPFFEKNKAYDLTVSYCADLKRVVLFMDGEAVQVMTYTEANEVTLSVGHLRCSGSGANFLSDSATAITIQGSLGSNWENYEAKFDLGQDAATIFASVGASEAQIFDEWETCVLQEKALLNQLLTCRHAPPQTWQNLTEFACDMLTDACDETSVVGAWDTASNTMMTALHTQYGDCNYPDLITKNAACQVLGEKDEDTRCDLGSQFLVMYVDATYIGAHADMEPTLEYNTELDFTGTEVKFKDGMYRVPKINHDATSYNDPWLTLADYNLDTNYKSRIATWGTENAFVDLGCN